MPLVILTYLVQIGCAVHALKRGYPYWILFFIIAFPGVGCIVYILAVLVPELQNSRQARGAAAGLHDAIDPERHVRRQARELRISDTVENKLRLADELLRANDPAAAIPLYRDCLQGPFADNPDILLKFAEACFANAEFIEARQALEELFEKNPNFRSEQARLLHARALEGLGRTAEALAEYAPLSRTFNGPEAMCRYGLLLKLAGRAAEAERQFRQILETAELAPRHYRTQHAHWIRLARSELG